MNPSKIPKKTRRFVKAYGVVDGRSLVILRQMCPLNWKSPNHPVGVQS
jgi:hypothetical protein